MIIARTERFFISVFIIFLAASGTTGDDLNRIWENYSFGVGERMFYNLDYAFITAGNTEMKIDSLVLIDGKECYHIISQVKSSRTFDFFFKVRDKVETFVDARGIYTRRYMKNLREGPYRDSKTVNYEQENGLAHLIDKGKFKKTSQIQPCAQDILSALYFIRTLDFTVGDTISINLHDVRKSYPLKVKVSGREKVKVPAGEFDCLIVEPFLESEGMFRSKGRIQIWLTADRRKIPVLMRTYIVILGHIDAKLADYQPGELINWGREEPGERSEQNPPSK